MLPRGILLRCRPEAGELLLRCRLRDGEPLLCCTLWDGALLLCSSPQVEELRLSLALLCCEEGALPKTNLNMLTHNASQSIIPKDKYTTQYNK